ncbi:hypothetical protein FIV42_28760 [Persicimonas caeni]|uniref:Lipoprotein n=1 Tax=Persicimonas caeni TaxID=2292766 RepID=A0A4Y6Q223_PERCE|nr:hypothetical protein [Persicimonas caeni]QDG54593.1 hypothetical protein FIV42_28760 [Persicimonas caeni]QED35814.1 hypothetical protein FRD00_28755 [Persicimonas caeni]
MARLLQNLMPSKGLARQLPLLLVAAVLSGCILSPPIEPRDEPNYSPRIGPLWPNGIDPYVRVTRDQFANGSIELRAKLFDGNDESELHFLLVSDHDGIIENAIALPAACSSEDDADEYCYGVVDHTVNPCDSGVTIPGTEVITLVVSDRPFRTISPLLSMIEEAPDAIMVTYSWTLNYEAGFCPLDN